MFLFVLRVRREDKGKRVYTDGEAKSYQHKRQRVGRYHVVGMVQRRAEQHQREGLANQPNLVAIPTTTTTTATNTTTTTSMARKFCINLEDLGNQQ